MKNNNNQTLVVGCTDFHARSDANARVMWKLVLPYCFHHVNAVFRKEGQKGRSYIFNKNGRERG